MARSVFSIDFTNSSTHTDHTELEIRTLVLNRIHSNILDIFSFLFSLLNSEFHSSGSCNGIAFWTEYNFFNTPATVVSTGPLNDLALNKFIDWDMYTRQGVHLFWKPIESNGEEAVTIPCHVHSDENNVIKFKFA